MDKVAVDAYLERINFTDEVKIDLQTLAALQRQHLTAVPFENLHVFHRVGVATDVATSLEKIVDQRRGGWCFELNGAFAALLEALGFAVERIGAAVLLDGPNDMITHVTLQVTLDEPYLVDVGFGDNFQQPLRLNDPGEQADPGGTFQFMPSPKGTTLTKLDDGIPAAQFRFKRVAREMADFTPASELLQSDEERHWLKWPFATRLLDGGPDRVTLLADRLKLTRDGVTEETMVETKDWAGLLDDWFGMTVPSTSDL